MRSKGSRMSHFDHQDWTPVVFNKPRNHANTKDALKHARRTGGAVETLAKDHNREQRERARKLESETAVLPKLSLASRKMMTDARTSQGLTRDQLAQRINVKPKLIADLETGEVITDASLLPKVRRALNCPDLKFAS